MNPKTDIVGFSNQILITWNSTPEVTTLSVHYTFTLKHPPSIAQKKELFLAS